MGVERKKILSREEAYQKMTMMREKLCFRSRRNFDDFLCYINPSYNRKDFHRLIAKKCQEVIEGKIKRLMVFVPPQHGKEISDATLVPTPNGFVRHGDLRVGDYVFGRNGERVQVLATSEKVRSEYVVTFSDNTQVECHGNHEWVIYDRILKRERTIETKQMAKAMLYLNDYRFSVDENKYIKNSHRRSIIRIEKQDGLGMGNCIQVEGGVYLVTENYILTHNSEIISRKLSAWALGIDPTLKIVGASYSSDLATGFSRSLQQVMASTEYHKVFPQEILPPRGGNGYIRNADYFDTLQHGFYKAVGVTGSLTGTAVDLAIIDDPVKDALEAYSSVYRERVWDWYCSVLLTRLHNESRQILIMTRWHDDDLAGRILKQERNEWEVIELPALKTPETNNYDEREVGEALWEERHSRERLEAVQKRSPRIFSALYQQRPTIDGGNIVKRDWFTIKSYNFYDSYLKNMPVHFFIDTAYTEKQSNDPTGIIGAVMAKGTLFITTAIKVNLKFPDLIRFIPKYAKEHGYGFGSSIRIEPKANGLSVVHQLAEQTQLNVVCTPPPRDSKGTRLNAKSPFIESGKVALIEGIWNEEFIDEVCGFPAKAHDEYVDVLGYAIDYFFGQSGLSAEEIADIL